MAADATASTSSPSAGCGAPPPCHSAKPTTTALPNVAHRQNRRDGRSCAIHAPAIAVASGSNPITTAPWAAGTDCIAQAEKSGKPTTTPPATSASRGSSAHPGQGDAIEHEDHRGKECCNDRPAQAHEHRVERRHREPGRGQRQAEARHAQKPEQVPEAEISRRRGGCRDGSRRCRGHGRIQAPLYRLAGPPQPPASPWGPGVNRTHGARSAPADVLCFSRYKRTSLS